MPSRSKLRRILLRVALALLVLFAVDRIVTVLVVDDEGRFQGKALAPIETAVFQRRVAASVEQIRAQGQRGLTQAAFDPELGWTTRPGPKKRPASDEFGSRTGGRVKQRERTKGVRRILAFGCSFTFGSEVKGSETWCARLEELRPDVEVFNMGVPGYGLGQALLRFERLAPGLDPDEVWFVLMPSAAQRPSTHMPTLTLPWTATLWFKPRFEVGQDGALVRFPCPVTTVEEAMSAYEEPGVLHGLLAGKDPWFDRASGAFERRPEHALLAGRLYWTARLFRMGPSQRGCDGRGDSLVPLHRAIAAEARKTAEGLGAEFRYLVLPCDFDMPPPRGDDGRIKHELLRVLREDGVECLDGTPAIVGVPESERWQPEGHLTPRGNSAVAAWLAERI
ncbi:MAG: hypothetical protein AAF726_22995 [Planctomycetota bacterium]